MVMGSGLGKRAGGAFVAVLIIVGSVVIAVPWLVEDRGTLAAVRIDLFDHTRALSIAEAPPQDSSRIAVVVLPELLVLESGRFSGSAVLSRLVVSDEAPTFVGSRLGIAGSGRPLRVGMTDSLGRCVAAKAGRSPPVREAIGAIRVLAGREVFRLAFNPPPDCDGVDVRVSVSQTGSSALGFTRVEHELCAAGCRQSWIRGATIELDPRADVALTVHELLHALGAGHSCAVPSVMATEFTELELRRCGEERMRSGETGPLVLVRSLSPYDAAGVQILEALAAARGSLEGRDIVWAFLPGG